MKFSLYIRVLIKAPSKKELFSDWEQQATGLNLRCLNKVFIWSVLLRALFVFINPDGKTISINSASFDILQ